MSFINITVPSYPYYTHAGNAAYRPGDKHQNRKGLAFFDILLVESGTLYMNVNDKEYHLSANDVLILPPEIHHYGSKICTEKTFFHWMHFSTRETYELSSIPRIGSGINNNDTMTISLPLYQKLSDEMAPNAISLMKQLEVSIINYFTSSKTHIKSEINTLSQQELFLHLLGILSVKSHHAGVNDIAYTALQYLVTHYMESLTLDKLAEMLNCHPTHLIRCFKKQYGIPPTQMLIKIRLNRACNLLINPEISITSIAYSTGFSSTSYFCKQFKKNFNYTPQEYRERFNAGTLAPATSDYTTSIFQNIP